MGSQNKNEPKVKIYCCNCKTGYIGDTEVEAQHEFGKHKCTGQKKTKSVRALKALIAGSKDMTIIWMTPHP